MLNLKHNRIFVQYGSILFSEVLCHKELNVLKGN